MRTGPVYSAQQHLELSRQITAELEADTDFEVDSSSLIKPNRYLKPLGGLAIAASLTLAVTLGFNQLNTDPNVPAGSQLVGNQAKTAELMANQPAVATIPVSAPSEEVQLLDPALESELRDLSPEKQRRIRQLMMRDERRFGPQTRVVTYKDKKAP